MFVGWNGEAWIGTRVLSMELRAYRRKDLSIASGVRDLRSVAFPGGRFVDWRLLCHALAGLCLAG